MKSTYTMTGLGLLAFVIILSSCGQKEAMLQGQAFGSIASNVATVTPAIPKATISSKETAEARPTETASQTPDVTPVTPIATPIPTPIVTPSSSAVVQKETSTATSSLTPTPAPQTQIESSKTTPVVNITKPAESVVASPTKQPQQSNELTWDEFFDSDKQDTPSNKFWDLNGKTVHIKGFMGEVLSFDKHWFLLIPKPGAECPFDNGDETYWNKIMIVYVPDTIKLRYTSGPLQLTGRLDVGIKLDESGYKTMFRLYDASFEKIKE
ncbi:hypothetical protein [Paenibacillus oryzisoli]|uniref:Lipoprotein n=1 Tax=Paenibacillus oryzisoli TaxID=1850517 RepID=A0A197ZXK9_9BACL|nr:hypothetical protein [Paenibacillus oryzisoli]OAS13715.1 hypothetical protein A8708_25050 [Paenibacillus oryzisoli]